MNSITSPFVYPERSEWFCELFGTGKDGIIVNPLKGEEPNWFWRKMQYLLVGNKWYKNSPKIN